MPDEQWQARVTGALQAHFIQPDGKSRAGTDFAVELRRGEATFNLMIRGLCRRPRVARHPRNTQYQAQTAVDTYSTAWRRAGCPPTASCRRSPS